MHAKRDYALGIGLLCFAMLFWIGANGIPESAIDRGVGAQALPKALAYALGLLSVALLAQTVLRRAPSRPTSSKAAAEEELTRDSGRTHLRAFGIIAIAACYLILLPYVGYALGLFLMMSATALFMGRRLSWTLVLTMLFGATFYWLLFVKLLRVPMPSGLLLPGGIPL